MSFSKQVVGGLLLAVAFSSCAGDDQKKVARGEEAGEAGESSVDSGGSSASAGAPGVDGGTSPRAEAGAATSGGAPQPEGGTSATSEGGTPPQTEGGAPSGTPITINGIVVARNEQPVPGVEVAVQGESVFTAADGTFSIEATAPYDLVVRGGEVGGQENTEVYLDLTRADPKLYRSFVDEDRQGGVSGVLSGGGGFPVAANHRVQLSFSGAALATFSNTLNAGAGANYNSSGDPYWLTTPSLTGYLVGIEVDATTGAILATGTKQVTLLDGQTVSSPEGDLALTAAQLKSFGVTLNKPAAVTLSNFFLSVGMHNIQATLPTGDLTVQVPSNLPDAVTINVIAYGAEGQSLLRSTHLAPGSADSVDLAWTTAPVINSPAANAQLAAGASFTYVKPASTVAVLNFGYSEIDQQTEAETSYYTTVYTEASNVSLARLLALQLDLPPGTPLDFSMATDAVEPTIDAFVAPARERFVHEVSASTPSRFISRAF